MNHGKTKTKKRTSTSSSLTCGPQTAQIKDLNPVDYAVCGVLQQRVYHRRKFNKVEELKTAIITEWQKLSQRLIDSIATISGVVVLL